MTSPKNEWGIVGGAMCFPDYKIETAYAMKGNVKLLSFDRVVPLKNPKLAEKFTHKHNAVSNPSHYTDARISPIEYIAGQSIEQLRGFCVGNAIKYLSRAGKKDEAKTVEDLEKAVWYIQYYIEELKMLEGNQSE